jgi:hypothetical protein
VRVRLICAHVLPRDPPEADDANAQLSLHAPIMDLECPSDASH